jgi:hypothetical protein
MGMVGTCWFFLGPTGRYWAQLGWFGCFEFSGFYRGLYGVATGVVWVWLGRWEMGGTLRGRGHGVICLWQRKIDANILPAAKKGGTRMELMERMNTD